MGDMLGPVPVPDPPLISQFPLTGDYGTGADLTPPIAIHVFDQPGLRTEQRYMLGSGARRFRIQKDHLACGDYDALKTHWLQAQGQYAYFPYRHPKPDGTFEIVNARYENPNLALDHLVGLICSNPGLTLLEVPTTTPSYTATTVVSRFPDSALTSALLSQVQQFIPLITIQPRAYKASDGTTVTPLPAFLANQRCNVTRPGQAAQLYLPRLLQWGGISQTIGEASDSASFTLGNADDVFTSWANQVSLYQAAISFSLFHVNTNYLIDLWAGFARPWTMTTDGKFELPATDGVFELTLGYPTRQLARTCWKVYRGRFCPASSSNGFADCPKSYEACVARGVPKSFGGVVSNPQTVQILDNSTGVWGFGRSWMQSVSIAEDTIYQRPVQEVYTDIPMVVTCDVAEGRDESEFYSALGIVGEGPLTSYDTNLLQHHLDNQPPHDPLHGGGWRPVLGNDPAADSDFFGLSAAPWTGVPYNSTYAAGLAFAEIRRTDEAGLQLSAITDRVMTVSVTGGIAGWTWTAPGNRVYTPSLSNPIWVAINIYLRARGLRLGQSNASLIPAATMEQYFDVNQAIQMAALCELSVPKLVGTGNERQYPFRGVLKERKPLRDWLQEVMNCCLGFFTFVNGKLWVGIRNDSSVHAGNAFTRANILYQSLQAAPVSPQFNWLVGEFGDEEFLFALNSVTVYDMDQAVAAGSIDSPEYHLSTMNFVGVSNKSQCARIITTRLREELGGVGPDEQRNARNCSFRTTLLALQTMVGDVVSLDHSRLPTGRSEGRVQKWILNPDFSIDIQTTATTDSMYAVDAGPKPDDVPALPVPPDVLVPPAGLAWMPNHVAPAAGDPLYPNPLERTFDLWQDYNIARDGIWTPAIWVGGEGPINQFVSPVQPRILGLTMAAGGTLTGPQTVYVGITQHDVTGARTMPSNMYGLWIPAGVSNQKLTITVAPADGTWSGYDVYVGNDRRQIALQSSVEAALPSTIMFSGPVAPMTQELPEAAARRVRIAAKHVWHSGVAGVLVTGVTSPNRIQCNDFIGSTDPWVGRIVSALADASDGSAPLWNFNVTAFDSVTGEFTVTPNCVVADPADSVEAGDVLVVRSIPTDAGPGYVEDSMWNNSVALEQFGTPGLRPNEEAGRTVRILRGTGAGQIRAITSNTATRIMLQPDWDIQPAADSIIIVEAADYDTFAETSDLVIPRSGNPFELRLRVDNLADRVALVAGYLVDDQERITDEQFAVFREIYVFGQPPTVRVVGPQANDPATGQPWLAIATDHSLRADCSTNDVMIQLPPLYVYQGRGMLVVNDKGSHQARVKSAAGETFYDGSTEVAVDPGNSLRVTAG
jgi:hypothetical protein